MFLDFTKAVTLHSTRLTNGQLSGCNMANATLQSFNAFLTERLTAAAVDIYGFVEKTVIDYQDEVYRTKLENQRLQRLLDLVYRPEIRLHRADSRQIDLPTQEVCAQEQKIEKECIPTEVKEEPVIPPFKEELIDPWARTGETPAPLACSSVTDARIVTVGEHEENEMADNLTQVVTVGEHSGYEAPDSLTQVVTVGEHSRYEAPDSLTQVVTVGNHDNYDTQSKDDQPLLTFGVSPLYTREKNMFFCNLCHQSFLNKAELKLHLESHATKSSSNSTNKVFTCFVCGKVTNTKSHMMSHMRSHTGEKPYSCSICGNQYKLKGHMKEHLRTHTGERPFTCFICGMSFNRSSTMSKHARIRHREYVPFKCTECSQRFPVLAMLKQHMKTVHDITFSV